MPTPKRIRDKAYMVQKTREWRACQRALKPTGRPAAPSSTALPPAHHSAPARAARERCEISYFVKFSTENEKWKPPS